MAMPKSARDVSLKVQKRDGKFISFDQKKIISAISKAIFAVNGRHNRKLAEKLSDKAVRVLKKDPLFLKGALHIENIQDVVEKTLIKEGFLEIAKSYILYRDQHAKMRNFQSLIDSDKLMDDYLKQLDWRVKENSNMDYSLQGLNNYVSASISSHYWLNRLYSKEIREAHLNGDFHIHDLQLLSAYCCGWDLKDLLLKGFGGVSSKVESKPAKHLRAILGQVTNFFYTLQGETAGAQAISNFDTYLAPFIRYDNLNYGEVKQALQEFMFNMNVPTRVGFQTPFTNITLDLNCPSMLGEEYVIIGGEPRDERYKDFQKEMDIFNSAFIEVLLDGDAKKRVFTFPIPTYNISKDFQWESPVADKIFEMTAKYGIPYFSNFVNSDMNPEDARSMCPIGGEEKVLIKSSRGQEVEYSAIRNIYEGSGKNEEYEIYSDGEFVKGKFSKFNGQKMIKVVLDNGHEIKMTTKHLNYVMTGGDSGELELKGEDLRPGMYLPYSLNPYQGEGGNGDLGYFVGAYAGDGSFDGDGTVVFSLEDERKGEIIKKLEKISRDYFGAHSVVKKYAGEKLVSLKIHSQAAVGLCRDFVDGKERNKCYKARIFTSGIDFRKGVLKGHYATDGGNRNRIYTLSWKMVETLNMLAATLGTATSIYKDEREGRFGKEPNYAVLVYQLNRNKYGSEWFKKRKKLWVRIKSIEKISDSAAYCFEVKRGKPIFTVGTTGILTHNCRLRLDNRELRKRGGIFAANPLTGSIGVVTVNMPRLGYVSKSKKEFLQQLERLMDIAKESLETKRKYLERFTAGGLYPFSKHYLSDIQKRFGQYWKNHFNTIGLNGMNEACLNLLKKGIATKEGREFSCEVLDFMRQKLLKYQEETGNLFNLEATPAEGTAYRFAKIDKKKYPDIIAANEENFRKNGAAPYYTNSTHLPVNHTDDIFEALKLQDDLQTRYTGGTVLHGFIGEKISSSESVKRLVKKIAENFRLPYFTITPTFSICPVHGYLAGEHFYCPKCEEGVSPENEAHQQLFKKRTPCEVYSRVVGYIRPIQWWNSGKQEEYKDRKTYKLAS